MVYKAEAVWTLTTNNAAALNYKKEQNYGHDVDETMLSWRTYF